MKYILASGDTYLKEATKNEIVLTKVKDDAKRIEPQDIDNFQYYLLMDFDLSFVICSDETR